MGRQRRGPFASLKRGSAPSRAEDCRRGTRSRRRGRSRSAHWPTKSDRGRGRGGRRSRQCPHGAEGPALGCAPRVRCSWPLSRPTVAERIKCYPEPEVVRKPPATRRGKLPPAIPTRSEVVQRCPRNTRQTVAPGAEVLAKVGHTLADAGQIWTHLGRDRPKLVTWGHMFGRSGPN